VDYADEYQKWLSFFNAIDPEKALPALPAINSDKERVFLASNNVLTNYYTLQQQQINLKRYTIIAPFDGSFKSVNKEIGAIASPSAELATLIRSDKFEVVVPVFPKDLKWIKIGNQVNMIDNQGNEYNTTVSRISGFVDAATQSVNVYLTYNAKPESQILEGEYVEIVFSNVKVMGFEIPKEALVDNFYVYKLEDNMLHKTKIEVVRSLDDSYIISGIDSTNIIVTESLASVSSTVKYVGR
jgi:RND family efflux transporter MFP subunit